MKKLTFSAVIAVAAIVFSSCGNSTPKANLKNDIDTLSYAMGLAQTEGLKDYLVRGLGVDTTYIDEFIKGLNDGANAGDDKKKAAYYAGIQIGQQISNQMVKGINHELFGDDSTKSISMKNLMAGFISGTTGKKKLFSVEQAQGLVQTKMEAIRMKAVNEKYAANKKAGEEFLAKYAKQEGVKKLEGGVLYKVLKEGTGKIPADTALVSVRYEGKTIDGNVFESSYEKNDTLDIYVNQVIKGWTIAMKNMPVGSIWEVAIPEELAYGPRERPSIKPLSVLVFKIELLGIKGEGKDRK
ncbi:MAG: FKBP-type peptidyl-prolyl cis-trans isomerase [Prevotella sp.]